MTSKELMTRMLTGRESEWEKENLIEFAPAKRVEPRNSDDNKIIIQVFFISTMLF
jgi:hypothetical protein